MVKVVLKAIFFFIQIKKSLYFKCTLCAERVPDLFFGGPPLVPTHSTRWVGVSRAFSIQASVAQLCKFYQVVFLQ